MLLGSHPRLKLLSGNFNVKVNNIPIERVTVYKSLGVSTDENLSWKTHIDEISKKISAGLSGLHVRWVTPTIYHTKLEKPCTKLLLCPILITPAVCGDNK